MKISLKTALLSATLLVSMQPMLRADGQLCEQKKCIVKKDVAEALLHFATHGVACVSGLGMMVGGIMLDEAVKQKTELDTNIGAAMGTLAAFCTIYNMPQWTDTYLLGKDAIRSRAQNVIVFISRMLVPYMGVFVGEMFNIRPQDVQAVAAVGNADSQAAAQAPVAQAPADTSAAAQASN
jgi:hypothetical protein